MTFSGQKSRLWGALSLLLITACLVLSGCARRGADVPGDLLQGRAPSRVLDVTAAEKLTDGAIAREGDHWETDLTAVFRSPTATVEWDLGRPVRLRAAYLQGDNNDKFFLSGSLDGKSYSEVWVARDVRGAGMRPRFDSGFEATARYLRLTAQGGDAAVSASELQVFEVVPEPWPPLLRAFEGQRPRLPGEVEALVFGIVASLSLLLHRRTFSRAVRAFFVAAPVLAGVVTYQAVMGAWPPGQAVIDALRAVSAAVGAVAVLRLSLGPESVQPRFVTGTLAAMAFLALTTFYNMWQPQFEDVADGRATWVHTWDMRVYFPTAKYFDELGFDGLYLASVAAYLEDAPGADESRIAGVDLRDLRNYEMTTVGRVHEPIHAVKLRFSPARWLSFKHDMAFFWRTMGPGGYLGSLRDHGGNATPAWLLAAHLMFRHATATEGTLLVAAALDPLLLIAFFVAALRTFGVRTALVCLIVYGSSTFPWFGSNWAGSTLRNDWMVLVGLGVCALRTERWATGGALLAGGAMIRAFPATAVFFLAAPLLVSVSDALRRSGRLPDLRGLIAGSGPLFRALGGALGCVVVLTALSSARFGFAHSWGDWSHKILLHSVTPNVNHVGLRTLFQFDTSKTLHSLGETGGDWAVEQTRTFLSRRPFFLAAVALFTLLAIAAARGRDLRQAALIGMMMIPIYFYPSNYYLHYVFVLPLLIDYSDEPRQRTLWGLVSFVVLVICVSEYWGFDARGVDERYVHWSWGVLVGYLVIFGALVHDGRARPEIGREPEPDAKAPVEAPT
jgi:hypothetical protein